MWNLEMGELKKGDAFADAIHAVADKVESEHGITVRNMRKNDLEAEIGRFMEVYNSAWERNWGFVPITDEEVAFQAKNLKQILDPRWTFMAERDGEILGAALTLPDINQVTKKMNGRLLPFGWLRFLLGKGRIDRVRVFALGVKPEYQHTGIAARFYVRHIETAAEVGVSGGEEGWILEVNEPMNRAMEGMGGDDREALPALREDDLGSLVGPDQLGAGEHMALHRVLEPLAAAARFQVELGIQCEELVKVAMSSIARGRARTPVAGITESVGALGRRRCALLEATRLRVDVPRDPVGEVPRWGVGVVDDQGEGASPLGEEVPAQRWRVVVALAGILLGNLFSLAESGAGQLEVGHWTVLDLPALCRVETVGVLAAP